MGAEAFGRSRHLQVDRLAGRRAERFAPAEAGSARRQAPLRAIYALGDVLVELLVLGFELAEAGLDDVADRDHAAEHAVVVDDREMADPSLRHRHHQRLDGVLGAARDHVGRHHRRDGPAERRRAVVGQRPHDIALGHDPVDVLTVVGDDERSDRPVADHHRRVGQRHTVGDRDDVGALGREDRLHVHGSHPLLAVYVAVLAALRPRDRW